MGTGSWPSVDCGGPPYPSVFARDTGGGTGPAGIPVDESHLDPTSPFAGKGWGHRCTYLLQRP